MPPMKTTTTVLKITAKRSTISKSSSSSMPSKKPLVKTVGKPLVHRHRKPTVRIAMKTRKRTPVEPRAKVPITKLLATAPERLEKEMMDSWNLYYTRRTRWSSKRRTPMKKAEANKPIKKE